MVQIFLDEFALHFHHLRWRNDLLDSGHFSQEYLLSFWYKYGEYKVFKFEAVQSIFIIYHFCFADLNHSHDVIVNEQVNLI